MEEGPESLEEVDEILEHGVFHPTHFIILKVRRLLIDRSEKSR